MAVAEASFSTVKVSMSLGLMVAKALGVPGAASLATGIPSITINGSLLAFNDAPPRMRILLPAPGCPSGDDTCSPGTLPCINSCGEVTAPLFSSSALRATTEPLKSFFLTEP